MASSRLSPPRRLIALAATAWIGTSIGAWLIQTSLYPHYAAPLAVPLAILAVLGLERFIQSAGRIPRIVAVTTALVFVVCAGISAATVLAYARQELGISAAEQARVAQVASRSVVRHAPPGPIFVWGNAPSLYTELGRVPASRYPYLFPLVTPGYDPAARVAEVIASWEAEPPVLVIDAGSAAPGTPGLQPLLLPRPLFTDGRRVDLLDPLREFVRERYRLLENVEGWPVYGLESAFPEWSGAPEGG